MQFYETNAFQMKLFTLTETTKVESNLQNTYVSCKIAAKTSYLNNNQAGSYFQKSRSSYAKSYMQNSTMILILYNFMCFIKYQSSTDLQCQSNL